MALRCEVRVSSPWRPSVLTALKPGVSRCRRSSWRRWWSGWRRSPAPLSWWTKTAAWSPPWSIIWDAISRMWRDIMSKPTKGKRLPSGSLLDRITSLFLNNSHESVRCGLQIDLNTWNVLSTDLSRLTSWAELFFSSEIQSSCFTTSWNRPWMLTGTVELISEHLCRFN